MRKFMAMHAPLPPLPKAAPVIRILIPQEPKYPPPGFTAPRQPSWSHIINISEVPPSLVDYAWSINATGVHHPTIHPGYKAPGEPNHPPTKRMPGKRPPTAKPAVPGGSSGSQQPPSVGGQQQQPTSAAAAGGSTMFARPPQPAFIMPPPPPKPQPTTPPEALSAVPPLIVSQAVYEGMVAGHIVLKAKGPRAAPATKPAAATTSSSSSSSIIAAPPAASSSSSSSAGPSVVPWAFDARLGMRRPHVERKAMRIHDDPAVIAFEVNVGRLRANLLPLTSWDRGQAAAASAVLGATTKSGAPAAASSSSSSSAGPAAAPAAPPGGAAPAVKAFTQVPLSSRRALNIPPSWAVPKPPPTPPATTTASADEVVAVDFGMFEPNWNWGHNGVGHLFPIPPASSGLHNCSSLPDAAGDNGTAESLLSWFPFHLQALNICKQITLNSLGHFSFPAMPRIIAGASSGARIQ